jgi:hypothetical protein
MELSRTVATVAIVLGVVLAAGYASSQDNESMLDQKQPVPKQTAQEKIAEREAQRREAMKVQQERKEEFTRRCGKSLQSAAEQEFCRAAYRKL